MNSDPLYIEIADHISEKIIRNELPQNGYIDSPKIWAEKTGLNPNSVSKAYDILLENRIIYKEEKNIYKCSPESIPNAIKYRKDKLLSEDIVELYQLFKSLNVTTEEINRSYNKFLNKG